MRTATSKRRPSPGELPLARFLKEASRWAT